MVDRCLEYAEEAKRQQRPVVGIMCEFTPRELVMAAGGVPVCLCGGSQATISPAEQFLPGNLCPLIKSTYGYHVTGRNPFLKIADLVIAETTCDGKTKMFELLAQDKPMHVLNLPHRSDSADALAYWVKEVRSLERRLEDLFSTAITKDRLREAIGVMNRERHLRRELADLMRADPPPLSGRQLLEMKSLISGMPADLEQYENILSLFEKRPELKQTGCATTQRPIRVLLTGVPLAHGAERVIELIEERNARVVCQENCTGLKPILEDADETHPDPLLAIAEKYYHLPCSVMTSNKKRLDSLRVLTNRFRPECVIELIWHACLTYDIEAIHVRKLVEEELRLPYLKITTDYSPADSARIGGRLDALFEMVESKRA
jgi:benzoyl-CoA reductase/2-hydroxyglutaryl-CoA dehydratase subunit BcrC/BadD/HgdB